MSAQYRQQEVTMCIREDTVEVTATVELEFCPAEPDVGIMSSSWNACGVTKTNFNNLTLEEESELMAKAVELATDDEPNEPDGGD